MRNLKKIKKALWGASFNSSPLISSNPEYSLAKSPNYNNVFNLNLNSVLSNKAQKRWDELLNKLSKSELKVGTTLMSSADPIVSSAGNSIAQNSVLELSDLELESSLANASSYNINNSTGSDIDYASAINTSALAIGNTVGGKAGFAISKLGGIAGNIKNLKEISKVGGTNAGMGKAGNIAAIAGAVSDIASSFLPEKTEYSGDKGNITLTMDTVYDGISDAAMSFGPVGMLVGGIMKGGKLLGGVMNSVGGGTDGMTTTDAILGSSFLNLTPIGLINGFGGKKANTITKNNLVFEQVGSSYGGSNIAIDNAVHKSGKKYGLFSNSARREANREIEEARRLQNIIEDIADIAADKFSIRNSMTAINNNRRRLQMLGGPDQVSIRIGRHGMIIQNLQRARRITSSLKYQKGGKVTDPFQSYLLTLPENQWNDSNFRVRDYWEFNGRPKDFNEAISKGMFTQQSDGWHANSVAENPATGEIEFMKSSSHPNHHMEVDWYNSDDGAEFRSQYKLQETEPYWKYVKRKGSVQSQSFKEGGSLTKSDWLVEVDINNIPLDFRGEDIEEVELDNILPEFKEGGSFKKRSRTLEELIAYAKQQNPRFILRMSEPIRDVDLGNGYRGTHRLSWGTTDNPNEAIVYPEIFENENGELVYDPEHAFDNAKTGDMLIMTPEEAEIFIKEYKLGWPEFFLKFAEGGKFNLIPEGALHARKHNMDVEGITLKGIPVVSETEGGELEQQAEIEREEVILRLEVTKEIEELKNKYENASSTEKDSYAIEAGKLLTYELLHNTIDNTGLLNNIL